jgi:hypothetical protein
MKTLLLYYITVTVAKDIENQLTLLNGLIYEDNNIEDDDIEMQVWNQPLYQ